uniref:Uncharacterized protein n=1 Tax=Meloidogyne enterolobii TaxID=390850 RepID=A0A6V7XDE0_MELEN|nr:unnamed protein product [Meloidogyne enterolobii]CAD2197268.1 unnamed protein product [Meloidogyne enterolobii]
MSSSIKPSSSSAPFDENNIKYFCFCKKLHIRTAARLVSILLVIGVVINIFYSFGRTSTLIIYSWVLATFAIGVYGSLVYGVFREKRIFTMPFLVFQASFIFLIGMMFFVFMICAMFSVDSLKKIAYDFGGINENETNNSYHESIRGFVIMVMLFFIAFFSSQCWFFEVIYRFYQYLEERESSFAFNLEPEFSMP